ncbi:regulatory protein RecX [Gardnerella sp. DNF00536]|uniref:regulatory protein RecX n=1 Tax=Gardnerella sp. DNF00536 TaxID=2749050 RepID=UPI003BB007BD
MVISVASFLREHPVVLAKEEDCENDNNIPRTRKQLLHKTALRSTKHPTNNISYGTSAVSYNVDDELCESDESSSSESITTHEYDDRDGNSALLSSSTCISNSDISDISDVSDISDSMQSSEDIAAATAIAAGEEVTDRKAVRFRFGSRKKAKNNLVRHGSRIVQQVSAAQSTHEDDCKEAALRLLDYAPRSVMDMRQRLQEKGYSEVVVEAVIQRLLELHLLDDYQYAHTVIRSCIARMLGAKATRMELQHKKVDPAAIAQCMASAQESGVFNEAAWELGRKTAQRTKNLEPLVRRRRFFAAAARKGHDLNVITKVYENLFNKDDE